MLDIILFREEKGNNPEIIRNSQHQRFANVEIVNECIHLDKKWRQGQFELEQSCKDINRINKQVAKLRTAGEDASSMIKKSEEIKGSIAKKTVEVQETRAELDSKLELVGNLVHGSVPVSNDKKRINKDGSYQVSENCTTVLVFPERDPMLGLPSGDEANNAVVRTWGEKRTEPKLKNHVELAELLGIVDLETGAMVAGKGGVFLVADGVDLFVALIHFGLDFLKKRGSKKLQTPFFMKKNIMGKCAHSAQYDEQLYKVTGEGDDKYLISTAEQPLCAYNIDRWIDPKELPLRYVGHSACFRKEFGEEARGLFDRCHFDTLEQLCITSPNGNDSWDMHEEMIKNSEELYQLLKLPYQIVSVVSGALNNAAAKTYNLEAWFPGFNTYTELASCSNYTDYKSRKLEIRFGHKKGNEQTKQYCHLLKSSLTDIERTMCCILENYQKEDGVEVPEILQPYMDGKKFMRFQPRNEVLDRENREEGEISRLDINLFREEKGNDPEIIRESQRRRFASVAIVDEISHLDKEWQRGKFELERLHKAFNRINIVGDHANATRRQLEAWESEEVEEARVLLYSKLDLVGNLVHNSVPVSNDEANNVVVRTYGEKRTEPNLKNHVELVERLGIADLETGPKVAGGRGYFLIDAGVELNEALIKFGIKFLKERSFKPLHPPLLMTKNIMGKCAQLAQFDEELYKVTGGEVDKYLIATSEQPLCAYNIDRCIDPKELPLRYVGYSSCFRKEAGSHGRDTTGIFRVHQFEKLEQFCITSPNGNDSWDMLEEMIKNSEEFYQLLKLPYRVVSIVSGALNDAAAKKYDLEAWFPASNTYRELVSCSNCTDYQSRKLGLRFGDKSDEETKHYCHLLNSTLTATERTMCCILENYQRGDGVEVPEVLQPFMGGIKFMPFKETKGKKSR